MRTNRAMTLFFKYSFDSTNEHDDKLNEGEEPSARQKMIYGIGATRGVRGKALALLSQKRNLARSFGKESENE